MMNEKKIVFLYRIKNYTDSAKDSVHVIRLTDDVSKVFEFLNMDYDDYKEQQFETIFDFTDWVVQNCKYLTVDIIRGIEKEMEAIPERDRGETHKMVKRFTETIKIGHIVLRDFQYVPIMMYMNLRESIIRNFFCTDDVDEQFIKIKLEHLKDVELPNKFSPKLIINWIRPLRSKPSLTGLFTTSFVNYVTKNDTKLFPRFLIDTDSAIVKKEVISYYYNLFPQTEAYRLYVLEDKENNEVE
jgi:hypothetical protein